MTEPERRLEGAAVERILEQFRDSEGDTKLAKPKTVGERLADIDVTDAEQNVKLRRHLAYSAFLAVGAQLLVCNIVVLFYGFWRHWNVDPSVMIAWISAAVAESVGIVATITLNLFPNGKKPAKS